MSEIGAGTGSSYPASLDTNSTVEVNSPAGGKTKARAEVPNDLAAAIINVQTELGTDPAGTLTDVKTFLQTEHNTNGTHKAITATSIKLGSTDVVTGMSATPAANTVPVTDALSTLKLFELKDHGSKSTNYGLDLSLANIHLVEFSADATLTISATNAKEKALVIIKNNNHVVTLAGIDTNAPTLTQAASKQDFLILIKSFGKITCVGSELNYATS